LLVGSKKKKFVNHKYNLDGEKMRRHLICWGVS